MFDNSYARLPPHFYALLPPTPVAAPRLVRLNEPLARLLGFDPAALAAPDGVAMLAGNRTPADAAPLAMAYAGHQFGNFVPQLGDGRAILLGEIVGRDGVRRDIQLKGAGRTPFSRGGDGRAALGPVLREYIVSEAMAALGIPTTRALAAVTTGEEVFREEVLPGAVLTRVARSHVRVGTFQYFAARGDAQAIRTLADYVIGRNYPEAEAADNPYVALLRQVIARTAALVARWQLVGFIHGVMNTDNMAVSGETIDYGPCAFMDSYHPATVYSSIDHAGRYAYGNQPRIAYWNLARLAETLLPLLADDEAAGISAAHAALDTYPAAYETAYLEGLRAKLGLADAQAGDLALGQALFVAMNEGHADFTLTFRHLCDIAAGGPDDALKALFASADGIAAWLAAWHARRAQQNPPLADIAATMRAVNPAFIPRNHRIAACIAAALAGDDAPFNRLTEILARPYDDQPEHADYRAPPLPGEVVRQTFCGT